MLELIIIGAVALIVFAVMFYQSYRDKERWNRISSGMSLFGSRENIPPLELEGTSFDSHERRVLLIWADRNQRSFDTVSDAMHSIEKERAARRSKARNARIFAWDGESWKQRK